MLGSGSIESSRCERATVLGRSGVGKVWVGVRSDLDSALTALRPLPRASMTCW